MFDGWKLALHFPLLWFAAHILNVHYFKYIGTKIGIHSITYVRFVLHFTLCCYLLGQKVRQLKGDASNVLDATFKLFCVSVRECIENRNNLNVKQHAAQWMRVREFCLKMAANGRWRDGLRDVVVVIAETSSICCREYSCNKRKSHSLFNRLLFEWLILRCLLFTSRARSHFCLLCSIWFFIV